MNEDGLFFQKAAEAIMVTSLNSEKVDPTIRELLNRVKYVSTPANTPQQPQQSRKNVAFSDLSTYNNGDGQYGASHIQSHNQVNPSFNHSNNVSAGLIAPENKTILNYFDRLLSNPVDFNNQKSGTYNGNLHHNPMTSASSSGDQLRLGEGKTKRRKLDSQTSSDMSDAQSDNYKSNHKSTENGDSEDKGFPCQQCHMIFRRSSDLRRHERQHLSILPNICTLCGKGFARKDALKRHFDTQTCKRNRQKLLSIGGDINEILERARQSGANIYSGPAKQTSP